MKNWLVKICGYAPAPREFEYRERASSAGAAISRALRKFRQDVPRKKIQEFKISAKCLTLT